MTVSIFYGYVGLEAFEPTDHTGANTLTSMDMTALAGGGFALAGTDSGHVDQGVYSDRAVALDGSAFGLGERVAVDQLSNGNIVYVVDSGGSSFYALTSAAGEVLIPMTSMGVSGSSFNDVAALAGGGFVVAHERNAGGSDNNIHFSIRDADGEPDTDGAVNLLTANDRRVSVAGLADGGFALVWERDDGAGNTEVHRAVYNANGSVRAAGAVFDTAGSINREAQVTALADGGFAVAYEDNDGGSHITVATFDASGTLIDQGDVTDNVLGQMSKAAITALDNGLLAVSFTSDDGGEIVRVQLVDPDGVTRLGLANFLTDDPGATDSTLTGFGTGDVAVAWTRDGTTAEGATLTFRRTSSGDVNNNNLRGDNFVDYMFGRDGTDWLRGFGNDDSLTGGDGDDTLVGGRGVDTIIGGDGQDILTGGRDRDTFRFELLSDSRRTTPDLITDLAARDKIDIKALDGDVDLAGDQRFHLVDAFTGNSREALLRFHDSGMFAGKTTLDLDNDGDAIADFRLVMDGDHADHTLIAF